MRIDDTDPDELDDNFDDDGRPLRGPGSKRRKLTLLAGAALVIAGGISATVALSGGEDNTAAPGSSTPTETADTIGLGDAPIVGIAPDANGFPDYGSDYMGPQLETLFQTTTDTGIRLVLQNSGDWENFFGFAEGDGVSAVAIATSGAVPPDTGTGQEWTPPAWCNAIGGFRLTMLFKDAIGVSNGSRYSEPRDGLSVTLFSSGYAEGSPFRALVLNVADDVINATATWDDDASDSAAPSGGWVVLAPLADANRRLQECRVRSARV